MSKRFAKVDLAGVASVTLHVDDTLVDPVPLANDVLTSVALAVGTVGQTGVASHLAARFAGDSGVVRDLDTVFRLAGFFVRSLRVAEALALARIGWTVAVPTRLLLRSRSRSS